MQATKMGLQKQYQPVETYLIQSARKGNLEAFNRLASGYQDTAYNLAFYLLGDERAAETATSQGIGNAYRKMRGYPGSSFRSWMLHCVLAACQDIIRAQPSRAARATIHASYGVEDCLESLSLEQRTLVLLVDVEGLSYSETAWIVGKPLEWVRSGLAEARQRIGDAAGLVE